MEGRIPSFGGDGDKALFRVVVSGAIISCLGVPHTLKNPTPKP